MPYAASFLATYRETYHCDRFAGNLLRLREELPDKGDSEIQKVLAASIDAIFDSIVLPNGVRKTTFAQRQLKTLEYFLSRLERPPDDSYLRVLDLPSSNGIASIDTYDLLRSHYNITSYVLADLCLEVLYDREHNCIYDAAGRLLQVQGNEFFFSIYKPNTSGSEHSFFSKILLSPISFWAYYLKHKYAFRPQMNLVTIRLLDPESEKRVGKGIFTLRNADVFSIPWAEEFDLVFSFNLLQKSYFSSSKIAEGLKNLGRALKEGGYLVTGNTESFGVIQKTDGALKMLYQHGTW